VRLGETIRNLSLAALAVTSGCDRDVSKDPGTFAPNTPEAASVNPSPSSLEATPTRTQEVLDPRIKILTPTIFALWNARLYQNGELTAPENSTSRGGAAERLYIGEIAGAEGKSIRVIWENRFGLKVVEIKDFKVEIRQEFPLTAADRTNQIESKLTAQYVYIWRQVPIQDRNEINQPLQFGDWKNGTDEYGCEIRQKQGSCKELAAPSPQTQIYNFLLRGGLKEMVFSDPRSY